jgi:NADPH2:quinone reductase
VVERGRNATALAIGDKVFISARELAERAGGYAEYIAVPQRAPFRLPDGVDLEPAACLSNYQVAYHVLHTAGRIVPGGIAVVDQGAGGTGSALAELARLAGMRVIAIAGGPQKIAALKGFGVDHAIDHTAEDPVACVKAITGGHGADLVLDGSGGKEFAQKIAMLGAFGMVVSYGRLAGPIDETLVKALSVTHRHASPAVRFFTMHTLDDKPSLRAESMAYLIGKLREGAIRPLIHGRLPLSDARTAHEMLEARQVIGKVLLKPDR